MCIVEKLREALRQGDRERALELSTQDKEAQAVWLEAFIKAIFRAIEEGQMQGMRKARAVSIRWGVLPNPFGSRDSKVQAPANYRPVGDTCPECVFLDFVCYAQRGNVRLHQTRATGDLYPSLASAAIVIGFASCFRTLVRLHVSGDMGHKVDAEFRLDVDYIDGLCRVVEMASDFFGHVPKHIFTYTHFPKEVFEQHRLKLASVGIEVLYSGLPEAGGAVVVDSFDRLPALRQDHPNTRFAKCLFQLNQRWPCARCQLCPRARELDICIVFEADGNTKRRVREKLLSIHRNYL